MPVNKSSENSIVRNLGAEYKNLDQKVYLILRNMILDRNLLPGEKIAQEKLARDLGVSRTPLISALKYLEQEKLVESRPRRGFFVRLFTDEQMISIFEIREVLEGLAARRAATYATDEQIEMLHSFFKSFAGQSKIDDVKAYAREDRQFHGFIIHMGSREFLQSILQTYNIFSNSYQRLAFEGLIRSPDDTLGEHMAIIDAISSKNSRAAEELTRRHFQKSTALLQENMAQKDRPAPQKPKKEVTA